MKKWYLVLTLIFCLMTFLLMACGREVKKNAGVQADDGIRRPLDISDLNLPDTGSNPADGTETDPEKPGDGRSDGEPDDPTGGTDNPQESGDDDPDTTREIETKILEIYGSSLEYLSHGDGTCSVSGIGECTDVCVLIPEKNAAGEVVTGIEAGAFAGAGSLSAVQIPSTVTMIGQKPFEGCRNLVFISVSANNPAFRDMDGVLFSKDQTRLIAYPPARAFEELNLSTTVHTIESGAFKSCPYLKRIRYGGTEAEWGEVLIGSHNNALYAVSVLYKDAGK